jgi:hypothetical protein
MARKAPSDAGFGEEGDRLVKKSSRSPCRSPDAQGVRTATLRCRDFGNCRRTYAGPNSCRARCDTAEMHRRRLSEFFTATSGLQPSSVSCVNSIIREVYAGPTACPLPGLGTMSSRIARRLDFRASSTICCFGSATVSGSTGTWEGFKPKNLPRRSGSAMSQASTSLTATRNRISREGVGSQRGNTSGAQAPSPLRSTRTTQCRNWAEWL